MRVLIVAILSLLAVFARAEPAAGPPAWFLSEIESLTSGRGRWIADNSAYRSEDEPFEAYGIEWKRGFDGVTMTGRLFGLKDGKETAAFWEFRQYWHPGRNEAVLMQIGWGGVIGEGAISRDGKTTFTDQTFYAPDGASRREGHRGSFLDRETHVTESFEIVAGQWKPRRSYVWKLQAAED